MSGIGSIINVIDFVFFTVGAWHIFKKCGVNQKWALVPVFRIYKISQCADVDETGIMWFIFEMVANVLTFALDFNLPTNVASTLVVLAIPVLICTLFCRCKGYYALTKMFQLKKKKLWTLICIFYPGFAVLFFGLSKKLQPLKQVEDEAIDISSHGKAVEALEKGLSVNLESRIVHGPFGLHKKCLLKDIHLNIKPGRMVLLLGGSGAGKTTFLNAITGYEQANATVLLNGNDVYKNFASMQHDIGFVPQQDLIRYNDTVRKTVADFAKLRLPTSVKKEELNEKVDEALDIFGLQPVEDNMVAKQSGGQKKRTSISMEFVASPSLFILDEPDSGLDGVLALDLMQRLHNISRTGKIVIVITHSPDRVLDLFDDVIILAKDEKKTGRLVFYGPVEDAKQFFGKDKMEDVIKMINRKEEGGEGLADELIQKFENGRKAE